MPRPSRLRVHSLEQRITPAELLHSLFPDATGPQVSTGFGTSVATGSKYRVVGASGTDVFGVSGVGQVFVYEVATNKLAATLTSPTLAKNGGFGHSVAVSGPHVVVSAYNIGFVYVYNLNTVTPTTPIATLTGPSSPSTNNFGNSVAVSGDYVVVGAPNDVNGKFGVGSAYVFDLASATPTTPLVTLANPTPAANDNFGISVAISGSNVVVGAWGDDTGATDAGSAYVYDLKSNTPTTPIATLNNPGPSAFDNFGVAVAVSGFHVVVGAYDDDSGAQDAGSAYIYDLSSMTPTIPITTFTNPMPNVGDRFGISVAVAGKYVLVGAHNDDTAAVDAGSAYAFDSSSISPTVPIANFNGAMPAVGDQFGWSMAASGDHIVIGALSDDTAAPDSGAAYVFDLSSLPAKTPPH